MLKRQDTKLQFKAAAHKKHIAVHLFSLLKLVAYPLSQIDGNFPLADLKSNFSSFCFLFFGVF